MSDQQTNPAAAALDEIRAVDWEDQSGLALVRQYEAARHVPRLIAVAEIALTQHRRSASPAYGMGSGDTHGKHYCAGLCHVSINHDTLYEPWPCFPYLGIFAALTGTTVVAITVREVAEHKASCIDCLTAGGRQLDGARCPAGVELDARWRRALREAGQQP